MTAAAGKDDGFASALTDLVAQVRAAEQAGGVRVLTGPGSRVHRGRARAGRSGRVRLRSGRRGCVHRSHEVDPGPSRAGPADASAPVHGGAPHRLATATATAGDHEQATRLAQRAEQIARTLVDPGEQAGALTGLGAVVGPPWAHRLLAAAMAVESWRGCLPVLAQLQPRVVLQIADDERWQ